MFVLRDFILFCVKPFGSKNYICVQLWGLVFSKKPPAHYFICSVTTFYGTSFRDLVSLCSDLGLFSWLLDHLCDLIAALQRGYLH